MKFIAILAAFTAALTSLSSAVSVNLAGIASAAVGTITANNAVVSGRAIFVSSTTALDATAVSNQLRALVNAGNSTSAQFDATLTSLIGATSATSPGIVRSTTFASGLLSTTGAQEMGNAGNFTYLFLVAETGTTVNAIGAYTGPVVPSLGAVTINPGTAGDTLNVGTSVFSGTSGTTGFQLYAVPEPSIALLGALGVFGLIRRRR